MKVLLTLFVLLFSSSVVGENYICVDHEIEDRKTETTIWERVTPKTFNISKIGEKNKRSIEVFYETDNIIVLLLTSDNNGGRLVALLLNKQDLTFGGVGMEHPFDIYDDGDFNSGVCQVF